MDTASEPLGCKTVGRKAVFRGTLKHPNLWKSGKTIVLDLICAFGM